MQRLPRKMCLRSRGMLGSGEREDDGAPKGGGRRQGPRAQKPRSGSELFREPPGALADLDVRMRA